MRDHGEVGIPGVEVTLAGVTRDGRSTVQTTRTDHEGFYQFAFLQPGVYSLFETQPLGYDDGGESLGTLGGGVGNDRFTDIVLDEGSFGFDYDFGEYARPGDADGDGRFTSSDLLAAFFAGEYEDGVPGNSTFVEGDWNGDGDFDSRDLVFALQRNVYISSARPA